jgi:lysophospholipase L1-like esterase
VWWDRGVVRPALPRLVAVALTVLVTLALAGCGGGSSDAHNAANRGVVPASPGVPAAVHRYVALGDSYTAAPLVPVTDVADGCFRSTGNYPSAVAKALGAHLVDRSCSGATTAHLWRRQEPGVPPQLRAVTARTDLVTLGIGGNDAGVFHRMLSTCAGAEARTSGTQPCQERMTTPTGRDRLLGAVEQARAKLLRAVREIHRRAPQARVLLVGYPQLLTPGHTCAQLPLAAGDYRYVEQVNRALDQNLQYVARHADATYVDVWRASQGHDICADEPWVNGSHTDRQRAAAFHPFAVEQQAVARLVVESLQR